MRDCLRQCSSKCGMHQSHLWLWACLEDSDSAGLLNQMLWAYPEDSDSAGLLGNSDSCIFQNFTGDSEVEGLRLTELGPMLPYRQNQLDLLGSNTQETLPWEDEASCSQVLQSRVLKDSDYYHYY